MHPIPSEHADFQRSFESGRRLFNTVDIGLVATSNKGRFTVISLRMTLGYSSKRTADLVFHDEDWFAVRIQRDVSVFDELQRRTYDGQALDIKGISAICHFQTSPTGWFSNGTHYRQDDCLWGSPSLRYHVGGSAGPLFDTHAVYLQWTNSINARADIHDLHDLVAKTKLRQPCSQYDHGRQFHIEMEYPLYIQSHTLTGQNTCVRFSGLLSDTPWRIKWKDEQESGQAILEPRNTEMFLIVPGRHEQLEMTALFGNLSIGTLRSKAVIASMPSHEADTMTPKYHTSKSASDNGVRVLFLSANPDSASPLKVEKEQTRITRTRNASRYQDHIAIEASPDLDITQFAKTMRLHKPNVLHFCGHGGPGGSLLMRDQNGNPFDMNPSGLARLIRQHKDVIQLVVLNACFSDALSERLVDDIDCVVGMTYDVLDEAAILFSELFYGALFDGASVGYAFESATAAVEARYGQEANLPNIRCRKDIDPDHIFPVGTTAERPARTPM